MNSQSHRKQKSKRQFLTTLAILCVLLASCTTASTQPAPAANTFSLQLLHSTNGQSEYLDPRTQEPKLLHFAAIVEGLRELAPGGTESSLYITPGNSSRSGPFYQASTELAELGAPGQGDVAILNAMGLVASGIGPYELAGGLEDFAGMVAGADYPFIATNLDFSNVELSKDVPPIEIGEDGGSVAQNAGKVVKSAYVEIDGERIGLIGRSPENLFETLAETDTNLAGLDFAGGRNESGEPEVSSLDQVLEQVDLLEEAGVNKIVLLDHEPETLTDPLATHELHGIDIVVVADADERMAAPQSDAPFNTLREGDDAEADYPTMRRDSDGHFVAVVTDDELYRYVGHLLVNFDSSGHIIHIDQRSGPVATTPGSMAALTELVEHELEAPEGVEQTFEALATTEIFQELFSEQFVAANTGEDSTEETDEDDSSSDDSGNDDSGSEDTENGSDDGVVGRQDVYTGGALLLVPGEEPIGNADDFDHDAALGIYNQRVDKTTDIDSDNVDTLTEAWQIPIPDLVSHTPIVEDGRLYFADWGGVVYAADAETGELLWDNEVETPQRTYPWHGFAGTGTLAEGLLIEASVEGNAFALDAETGEVIWQTRIAEQENAGNLSDLLYYDGLVYIGLQSPSEGLDAGDPDFEPVFRGNVVALDVETGDIVWREYLLEPPHNGASVWSSFGLDPELGLLYFTTSNNYTGEASKTSDALIAVDAKTGTMRWSQQVLQHDVWTPVTPVGADYGFGGGAQLFEAEIEGEMRQLVGAGQKSGIFFVFDRATGEEVWATFVGYGQVGGGIRGEGSVGTGRIYLWSNNSYVDGQPPQESLMTIKALDASTGRDLWVHPKAQAAGGTAGGFLSNDLFFVGSLDGNIQAYDASNGDVLWRGQLPGSVASSITIVGDTLYVGTGVPRTFGGDAQANGVLAFRLGQE